MANPFYRQSISLGTAHYKGLCNARTVVYGSNCVYTLGNASVSDVSVCLALRVVLLLRFE